MTEPRRGIRFCCGRQRQEEHRDAGNSHHGHIAAISIEQLGRSVQLGRSGSSAVDRQPKIVMSPNQDRRAFSNVEVKRRE